MDEVTKWANEQRAHWRAVATPGTVTYSDEYDLVCTCTEVGQWNDDGTEQHVSYLPTVQVVRSIAPTESGSWYYVCSRCGAGAWSGC